MVPVEVEEDTEATPNGVPGRGHVLDEATQLKFDSRGVANVAPGKSHLIPVHSKIKHTVGLDSVTRTPDNTWKVNVDAATRLGGSHFGEHLVVGDADVGDGVSRIVREHHIDSISRVAQKRVSINDIAINEDA